MISYPKIGHFGRLGNQMFQFAATVGIARANGRHPRFPVDNIIKPSTESFRDGVVRDVTFDIPKIFQIPNEFLIREEEIELGPDRCEQHFHFDRSILTVADGTRLGGYMQSEQYFNQYESEIRELFTFKERVVEQARKSIFYKILRSCENSVSIHVRRGDYVQLADFHPPCSAEYYKAAIDMWDGEGIKPHFFIFSDDPQYCRQLFWGRTDVTIVQGLSAEEDLFLMSKCNHNIIANSSFSWWGAWLNPLANKMVVAPTKWFGPAYSHNTDDLYPCDWILIDN